MEGKADIILFDSYLGISNRVNLLPHYVKLFDEQQIFVVKPHKELQTVVAVINGKLNTSVDREEGLQLLKAFLPQCSDEIFIDNYLFWMQQCVKGFENSVLSHTVLGNLLHCSGKVPELTKHVTATVVGKVIENLPKVNPEVTVSCLKCLEVLMRNYGPSCGPHKARLEQFLFSFADSLDDLEVETAARCISVSTLIGGGGISGRNHKAAWKILQEKIISEVHQTMDILFEDVPEGEVFQTFTCLERCGGLPALDNTNPVKKIHQLSVRTINLLKFLEEMLLHELPVPKVIQPSLFINLIGRGVSVNGNVIAKLVMEKIMLSCSLPGIHVAVLRLLNALIMCCGSNLLEFGYIICQLLLETLNWTGVAERWPYGASKPFAQLRIEACHSLVSWLKIARGGSCLELCSAEQLVLQLLSDIRVKKPSMSLSIDNGGSVGGNQKWKQSQRKSGQVSSKVLWNQQKIMNPSANSELCSAAISALQWVFQVSGLFLKPTLHKMVQETLVQLLFGLVRASTSKELPVPYSSAACRLQLYCLIFTLSTQPHPAWPAPIHYALQFLKMGQNDDDIQVSGFCLQSLSTLVRLMHPSASSLQFPVVYKDTERALEFQEDEKCLRSLASRFDRGTNDYLTENVCEPMDGDSSNAEIENCSVVLDSAQVSTVESLSVSPIKSLSDDECDQNKEITILINDDTVSSVVSSCNDSEVMEVEEDMNSNTEEVKEISCMNDKPSNIKLSSTSARNNSTEIQSPSEGGSEEIQKVGVEESSITSSEKPTITDSKSSEEVSAIKLNTPIVSDVNIEQCPDQVTIQEVGVEESSINSAEKPITDSKSSEDVSSIELNTTIVSDANIEQGPDQVIAEEVGVEESSIRSAEKPTITYSKSSENVSAIELNTSVVSDVNVEQGPDQVMQVSFHKEDNLKTTDCNDKQNVGTDTNIQTNLKDDSKGKMDEVNLTSHEVNINKKNESNSKMSPCKEHTKLSVTLERGENRQEEKDGQKSETDEKVECSMINAPTSNDKPVKAKAILQAEKPGMNIEKSEKLPHDESNDLKTSNGEPVKKKAKIETEAAEPVINNQQTENLLEDEYDDLLSSFKDSVVDE